VSSPALSCSPSCAGSAGDVVTLSCKQGYMLHGKTSLTCGDDGNWTSDIPNCLKLCSALTPPTNGSCSPKNCTGVVGDQVVFTCSSGLVVNGSTTLSCSKEGTWSNDVPFCSGKKHYFITVCGLFSTTNLVHLYYHIICAPHIAHVDVTPPSSILKVNTKKFIGPVVGGVAALVIIIVVIVVAVVSWKCGYVHAVI